MGFYFYKEENENIKGLSVNTVQLLTPQKKKNVRYVSWIKNLKKRRLQFDRQK